uniref:Envelope glycoprotein L n=1 Tax=Human herpesvirus 1 TaxID=10298 RepID=A0A0X8E9W9_HHV1|nr:envelope glycoprotein L [Human alphaherpesvirus 1]
MDRRGAGGRIPTRGGEGVYKPTKSAGTGIRGLCGTASWLCYWANAWGLQVSVGTDPRCYGDFVLGRAYGHWGFVCKGGFVFHRICYSESGGSRSGGYIKGALRAASV